MSCFPFFNGLPPDLFLPHAESVALHSNLPKGKNENMFAQPHVKASCTQGFPASHPCCAIRGKLQSPVISRKGRNMIFIRGSRSSNNSANSFISSCSGDVLKPSLMKKRVSWFITVPWF